MSNNYFKFKQFIIHQDGCGMKVGTDGVTLGAWCGKGHHSILDVGTGSGLLALMLAQRNKNANVVAIDIDNDAYVQACSNISDSVFASRISVENISFQNFAIKCKDKFDLIVSNPPYFIDSLTCCDDRKSVARHTCTLTYRDLIKYTYSLLCDNGDLSVILPADTYQIMISEAGTFGLSLARICALKTLEAKPPKRFLLTFSKQSVTIVQRTELFLNSDSYKIMTQDFYLDK